MSKYLLSLLLCSPIFAMQDWKQTVDNTLLQMDQLKDTAQIAYNNASEKNKILFQMNIDGIIDMKQLITNLKESSEQNNYTPDENDLLHVKMAFSSLKHSLEQNVTITNGLLSNNK